jgi:hypothetical protein
MIFKSSANPAEFPPVYACASKKKKSIGTSPDFLPDPNPLELYLELGRANN